MIKQYKIENLDCAHCANKIQQKVARLDGVRQANLNFMMQKLSVECDDAIAARLDDDVIAIVRKSEPDAKVRVL